MQLLENYRTIVLENLQNIFSEYQPEVKKLYEPIFYALEGGKKIRPVSTLLSADVFGGNLQDAVIPAIALEIFHNFTLLHDDVMDNSSVRRNRPTIQAKWTPNQAILSGDAMLILVYQKILQLPDNKLIAVMKILNKTGLQVCEGQQLDMDFENNLKISIDEYLQMIRLKTGVLIAASLSIGAIMADATKNDIHNIYDFGINLGLAFQIQDDYFDTFGDFNTFGKKIGNDIITNKKTFLSVSAFSLAKGNDLQKLKELYSSKEVNPDEKIQQVKQIFDNLHIAEIAKENIEKYYEKSLENLYAINSALPQKKQLLFDFAEYILKRKK
jgi:geranylgeranyl diphosphate synthase type II